MGTVKFGICGWVLPVDGPWVCKTAADIGFDGVQLELGDYERGFPLSRKVVQDAYLDAAAVSGIEFPSLVTRVGDYYSLVDEPGSRDHEIVKQGIHKAIDTAHAMGIKRVMIPTFVKSEIRTERHFEIAVQLMQEACDAAGERGIEIAAENPMTPEKTRQYFSAIQRENLSLYFDLQNYYLNWGADTPKLLSELYDLVSEVHAKDGKGKDLSGAPLGEGDVSFFESVRVLQDKEYSGWIVSENYYDLMPLCGPEDDPMEIASRDLATLNQAFPRGL
jgi:2-epi-5-epi-valiolone 7-phosphate 2-epimerase